MTRTFVQEQSGGSVTNVIFEGLDKVLTRSDASGTSSAIVDVLGSVLSLTDANGIVQTEYTYEPFGKVSQSGAATSNPSKFTGREDDGNGLYYYRSRYYNPSTQRFISSDPMGLLGGDNLYAYVANNPVSFTDPYGLDGIRDAFFGYWDGITSFNPFLGTPYGPPMLPSEMFRGVDKTSSAYRGGFYVGVGVGIAATVAMAAMAPFEGAAAEESAAARARRVGI